MKIAVIGATGFVGSAIVKEALDPGHEVTRHCARSPTSLTSKSKAHAPLSGVKRAGVERLLFVGGGGQVGDQAGCSVSGSSGVSRGTLVATKTHGTISRLPNATISTSATLEQ